MKKGRIVGQGTYQEIRSDELYKNLLEKYHQTEESHDAESFEEADSLDADQLQEAILVKAKSQITTLEEKKLKEEEKAKEEEKLKEEIKDDPALKKLVLDEDRQTGKVDLSVYKAFYNYYGGFCFFAFLGLSN